MQNICIQRNEKLPADTERYVPIPKIMKEVRLWGISKIRHFKLEYI